MGFADCYVYCQKSILKRHFKVTIFSGLHQQTSTAASGLGFRPKRPLQPKPPSSKASQRAYLFHPLYKVNPMHLPKEKLQHINSITHEGKVLVLGTDTDGKIWYTVRQDGFEDSALNGKTQVAGWENWQELPLPGLAESQKPGLQVAVDQSVLDKEQAELTYQKDNETCYVYRSRYQTHDQSAIAPVQLVSGLGHLYVFRQSKDPSDKVSANTLLIDRFILDGMTNQLVRKLDVRFKRSKQKYQPLQPQKGTGQRLTVIDSLDFKDADGNPFYEPTTELSWVGDLQAGWFSVVLLPTIEQDKYRWHFFAYNSVTKQVELTSIRASDEGLLDVKDYQILLPKAGNDDTLVPRSIPGVMQRSLDLKNDKNSPLTVVNGLAATKYDLQREQETKVGKQLLRDATRVMLAIPTSDGSDSNVAAFSFAVGIDGTLAQISQKPQSIDILRSNDHDVLLPLNTLDEIKAMGDSVPNPQGKINKLQRDDKDRVQITSDNKIDNLKSGDTVKITGTIQYDGHYHATRIDNDTFTIAARWTNRTADSPMGSWEVLPKEETGLIFDGVITAFERLSDGTIKVTASGHGLENSDEVQLMGTTAYNNLYPVAKVDDNSFAIALKWPQSEAVNLKLTSRKRRGMMFGGKPTDYIQLPTSKALDLIDHDFTVEAWIYLDDGSDPKDPPKTPSVWDYDQPVLADDIIDHDGQGLHLVIRGKTLTPYLGFFGEAGGFDTAGKTALTLRTWHHITWRYNKATQEQAIFVNGNLDATGLERSALSALKEAPATTKDIPPQLKDGASNELGTLYLGARFKRARFFNGKIADLRIWNVARTDEEIKNGMYLQLTGREIGLKGYWRLGAIAESATERTVPDFSIYRNDGIVRGDTFVSAVTLYPTLSDRTTRSVRFRNDELFAVTQRATYVESFEFKLPKQATLDPSNVDGSGNPLFQITHWGKSNRSSQQSTAIGTETSTFTPLRDGWYLASTRFTVPSGISLVRSFELSNVKGTWNSLEIRKHRIRSVSDAITAVQYVDSVTLTTLAGNQSVLASTLNQLELKEIQEAALLKEKRQLELDIANLSLQGGEKQTAINAKQIEIDQQNAKIAVLNTQVTQCQTIYETEQTNPLNYWCKLVCRVNERLIARIYAKEASGPLLFGDTGADGNPYFDNNKFKFVATDSGCYQIVSMYEDRALFAESKSRVYGLPVGAIAGSTRYYCEWRPEKVDGDYYLISHRPLRQVLERSGGEFDVWTGTPNSKDIQQWKIIPIGGSTNGVIANADSALRGKRSELNLANILLRVFNYDLNVLQMGSSDQAAEKATRKKRLEEVIAELRKIPDQLAPLNTKFINGVATISPQTMLQLAKDSNGLVTQSALLGFIQPAGRLNALETCEGNVQLSYFDHQGRIRLTNFDATSDSRNTTFEQWIPDGLRTCRNFYLNDVRVLLASAIALGSEWTIEAWFSYPLATTGEILNQPTPSWMPRQFNTLISGNKGKTGHIVVQNGTRLGTYVNDKFQDSGYSLEGLTLGWHHVTVVGQQNATQFYIDGKPINKLQLDAARAKVSQLERSNSDAKKLADARQKLTETQAKLKTLQDSQVTQTELNASQRQVESAQKDLDSLEASAVLALKNQATELQAARDIAKTLEKGIPGQNLTPIAVLGNSATESEPFGKLAEIRIWKVALSEEEIDVNSRTVLSGNEPDLLAYYPLNDTSNTEVKDYAGNNRGIAEQGETSRWGCAAPIGIMGELANPAADCAVVATEYVTYESKKDPFNRNASAKRAMMRRFLAMPTTNGVHLLLGKRVEDLDLVWIGNAQFAPTLLGYIEGAPPIPSENLTVQADYSGATSVTLSSSEDVAYSWQRQQEAGFGANLSLFAGLDMAVDVSKGIGIEVSEKALVGRAGFRGDLSFQGNFLNSSQVRASSSLGFVDRLGLRGTPEANIKFPHLGQRFIPKNVGYALVVSGLADVYITRLKRSKKMISYQVLPSEDLPPDVNTITFMINPAYTMNGSLDGLTGSSATSDRFFRHVPEMRAQYGSLYPASYFRLREAYDLKQQIESEDKRRQGYFNNFNSNLVDELSLNYETDKGAAPSSISLNREEDKKADGKPKTAAEQEQANQDQLAKINAELKGESDALKQRGKAKQAEIEAQVRDRDQKIHATTALAAWQTKMESLLIRAGKRNIVNTYVWDGDGGWRAESQQFASTVEHTMGSSFSFNAALGGTALAAIFGIGFELTAQGTTHLTQTMTKTESRSKGLSLDVDLSGVEQLGITDYNDIPLLPGEKVDRYRFMSFYLEGNTNHYHDFFNYVVDPEWLQRNSEEARALRQAMGKPSKAWRVLHRVTYVERPALQNFGQDVRKRSDSIYRPYSIGNIQETVQDLQEKIDDLNDKINQILIAMQPRG
jgi:Concanavalin A-like lectin/glucanases superfamily